jgi:hypothetical protein
MQPRVMHGIIVVVSEPRECFSFTGVCNRVIEDTDNVILIQMRLTDAFSSLINIPLYCNSPYSQKFSPCIVLKYFCMFLQNVSLYISKSAFA